jgi:hypothetical protein
VESIDLKLTVCALKLAPIMHHALNPNPRRNWQVEDDVTLVLEATPIAVPVGIGAADQRAAGEGLKGVNERTKVSVCLAVALISRV